MTYQNNKPLQGATPTFWVGNIPIHGELILSPMDGYSAWPFRSLCRELGSAISYTEFVNVRDILARPGYVLPKMQFQDDERPVAIQIYGDDPDDFLEAALEVQELEPDFIDINMGCPAKGIANRGAGSRTDANATENRPNFPETNCRAGSACYRENPAGLG